MLFWQVGGIHIIVGIPTPGHKLEPAPLLLILMNNGIGISDSTNLVNNCCINYYQKWKILRLL